MQGVSSRWRMCIRRSIEGRKKRGTGLIVVKFMFAGGVFRCFAAYVRPRVEVEQCLSHLVYTQGEEKSTMK